MLNAVQIPNIQNWQSWQNRQDLDKLLVVQGFRVSDGQNEKELPKTSHLSKPAELQGLPAEGQFQVFKVESKTRVRPL